MRYDKQCQHRQLTLWKTGIFPGWGNTIIVTQKLLWGVAVYENFCSTQG